MLTTPPVSLYIHFPWCVQKCPYCDFNSHGVRKEGIPQQAYVDALLADLSWSAQFIESRPIQSIFIGGGTPSLIEPDLLSLLLQKIDQKYQVCSHCEITLEANPGTLDVQRFKAFKDAGVNRLSLGVQSLNDRHLKNIGRIHNAQQARHAIEVVSKLFESFNLDLMYALPDQTLDELHFDLQEILSYQPPHFSIYHLTIENNTYFSKHPPVHLPDDDLASEMLDLICQSTNVAGLERYEVSAYAKEGKQCKHNRNYWEYGDYLGIGAGAHGKLTLGQNIVRTVRYRDPFLYMQNAIKNKACSATESIAIDERTFEFVLGALRLKNGVPKSYFHERTGLPPNAIEHQCTQAVQMGLLCADPAMLKATEKGFDFLSDLQTLFLPD